MCISSSAALQVRSARGEGSSQIRSLCEPPAQRRQHVLDQIRKDHWRHP